MQRHIEVHLRVWLLCVRSELLAREDQRTPRGFQTFHQQGRIAEGKGTLRVSSGYIHHSHMFAHHRISHKQEELEQTTERLSGMLEMPIEKILETPVRALEKVEVNTNRIVYPRTID